MKNKLDDVRDHLVAAMEALNADDLKAEDVDHQVDKAKAISNLANSYISSVKTEIEAIRLADSVGMLPGSVNKPQNAILPREALGRVRP